MAQRGYRYVIVGGGVAGEAAIEGIRELDKTGSILLLGGEDDLPYDRPPLSKQLWKGEQRLEEIYKHERSWYEANGVELRMGQLVQRLDPHAHSIVLDDAEDPYHYEQLLLATGGTPRRLGIPGDDLPGVFYYRTAADYRAVRLRVGSQTQVVVIGGGFIGSEMAAGLKIAGAQVTMVFPSAWLCPAVLPESVGRAMNQLYAQRGIEILGQQRVSAIEQRGEKLLVTTESGRTLAAQLVIAGIGIQPNVQLAQMAGLKVDDGIEVDQELRTSDANIYAAGDVASFPQAVLGRQRIEHWDNALAQGKQAGRNMAGAAERFDYLPFFFSDLFEFGYEAVGTCSSKLPVFMDWAEPNKLGTIYYLQQGKVRGVLTCGIFGKMDPAREMIRSERVMTEAELRGAIRGS